MNYPEAGDAVSSGIINIRCKRGTNAREAVSKVKKSPQRRKNAKI